MSNFLAETIGTFLLILFGVGTNAGVNLSRSKAQDSGWIVIVLGWGFAVAFAIYAVGKYSGAHINPAVSLGLAVAGKLPWSEVPYYLSGQFLGAFLGAVLVWFHYLPHWKATTDKVSKLGVFSTDPAIRSTWANLLSELIGTFALVLGLFFIGHNSYSEGLKPLIVGFLIMAMGFSFGGSTGYAINPARDLGPRIAHSILPISGKGGSNWQYSWIPVVGPCIGGMYGALVYQLIFEDEVNEPAFWGLSALVLGIMVMSYIKRNQSQ